MAPYGDVWCRAVLCRAGSGVKELKSLTWQTSIGNESHVTGVTTVVIQQVDTRSTITYSYRCQATVAKHALAL